MNKEEYINICKAVEAGTPRRVKHISTKEEGRVISCSAEKAFVEIELNGGERRSWALEDISLLP
ncbi:MAG: hypothetical protein R6V33_01160 [Pelovirga sp.]